MQKQKQLEVFNIKKSNELLYNIKIIKYAQNINS